MGEERSAGSSRGVDGYSALHEGSAAWPFVVPAMYSAGNWTSTGDAIFKNVTFTATAPAPTESPASRCMQASLARIATTACSSVARATRSVAAASGPGTSMLPSRWS